LVTPSPFGEGAQGGPHAARFHEGGSGAGGLFKRATLECGGAFAIHDLCGCQPIHEAFERADGIDPHAKAGIIGVHEVEPEPSSNEGEGRCGIVGARGHTAKIARPS
jgi:hypothetical protein